MLLAIGLGLIAAAFLAATQTRVARVCAAAGCVLVASRVSAQEVSVYLSPQVRAQLSASWDSTNARQHERAYCLGAEQEPSPSGELVYVVYAATRAVARSDGPSHTAFQCGTRPTLHIHTPTTCRGELTLQGPVYDYDSCQLGGTGRDVTWPSHWDQGMINGSQVPFGLIQFSAEGFTVFYPQPRLQPADAANREHGEKITGSGVPRP